MEVAATALNLTAKLVQVHGPGVAHQLPSLGCFWASLRRPLFPTRLTENLKRVRAAGKGRRSWDGGREELCDFTVGFWTAGYETGLSTCSTSVWE